MLKEVAVWQQVFYGTIDIHTDLEKNIADFLGTEDTILYYQKFSTVSSVIPAFAKRGDIIVVDRNINFEIQKGLQVSRSTILPSCTHDSLVFTSIMPLRTTPNRGTRDLHWVR